MPCLEKRARLLLDRKKAVIDRIAPFTSIKAIGRGSYPCTRLDSFGFPRGVLAQKETHFGCQTGDLVWACMTKGKKTGFFVGHVAVLSSGSFNVQTGPGVVQRVPHSACRLIQRADGYGYLLIASDNRKKSAFFSGLSAELSNACKG